MESYLHIGHVIGFGNTLLRFFIYYFFLILKTETRADYELNVS